MSKICKKTCDPNQICNLETGRCVLKNGAKGKAILSSQQKPPAPAQKPQAPAQKDICVEFRKNPTVNPRSGRKISNTGKVYKDLVKECGVDVSPSGPETSNASGPIVYNPFYKRDIPIYGEDNCGPRRRSLKYSAHIGPVSMRYRTKYCDVLPIKDIDNILGPSSYREYKMGDVNICLFGEQHTIVSDCPDIQRSITFAGFLKSILTQNQDKFYDFYVEFPYTKNPNYKGFNSVDEAVNLNLLNDSFRDCLILNKQCDYKNTRMHYIDYRDATEINTIDELYASIAYGNTLPTPDDLSFESFKRCVRIIKNFIKTDPRLKKQINQSYIDPQLYIKFADYYIDEIILGFYGKILNATHFIYLIAIVMDVYALARMFRTFNVGSSNMPSKPTNIIIYVGDLHANNYDNFFTDYLHLTPTINKIADYSKSCLHFSQAEKRKSVLFN